jgi:hypothetical protein
MIHMVFVLCCSNVRAEKREFAGSKGVISPFVPRANPFNSTHRITRESILFAELKVDCSCSVHVSVSNRIRLSEDSVAIYVFVERFKCFVNVFVYDGIVGSGAA